LQVDHNTKTELNWTETGSFLKNMCNSYTSLRR